ncbi:hypothetical protein [Prevotella ihumii]|uniref:hypothetical protein n=1 Tax=Prevotella ihumii TaxID=1917878 RepID=UPI000981E67E|nr:hypothetical protein [Prevotella ihumii]
MGKPLKRFITEFEHKIPQYAHLSADYEKISAKLKQHHIHLEAKSLRKLWTYVHTAEKPSKKTLDRLALFAGFQNWKDLQTAIHGDSDGQINFEDTETEEEHQK